MSARTAVRRGGGMLAVASMCALLTGSTLASTLDGPAASRPVASETAFSSAGWRSVASGKPARALATTKVARGVAYGGRTSANDPIAIKLSRDGRSVRRISTRFDATCTDSPGFVMFVDGSLNRKINAKGRFSGMLSGTDDLGSGVTARKTASMKGTVRGKRITGSFRFHVDKVDAAGAVVGTCDQTATFEAISARGRMFGGHTSQGGPVVVKLASKRNTVRKFHIGWEASCAPSGAFQTSETLIDFPLTGGSFGDDWTYNTPGLPPGESETATYSLSGKIKRARVTGTLRVKTTSTDATGTIPCDTDTISFTASSG